MKASTVLSLCLAFSSFQIAEAGIRRVTNTYSSEERFEAVGLTDQEAVEDVQEQIQSFEDDLDWLVDNGILQSWEAQPSGGISVLTTPTVSFASVTITYKYTLFPEVAPEPEPEPEQPASWLPPIPPTQFNTPFYDPEYLPGATPFHGTSEFYESVYGEQ